MSREIILPELTTYQKKVWDWLGDCRGTGKIAVIKSVRQSGKSFFCLLKLIEVSFLHKGVSAIYEPTLNLARNQYKLLLSFFDGSNLIKSANAQTLEIEFINGSQILFKSTEQTSRGLTISNLLILDECAYLDQEQIYTILPLVNAHNAPIIIASTPFVAEGYYYDMYLIGLEGNNDSVSTFDWSNEKEVERFLTEERKMFYKQTMSPAKFRTEVEGQFLTDNGLLFQNLDKCCQECNDIRFAYIGIDFGTGADGDYTVMSVVNEKGQQYKMYRTNNLSPMQQVDWLANLIKDLATHCTISKILAEKNSIGTVYIDALEGKIGKIKITDWVTSNDSKQTLVTTLQIALENEMVTILPNDIQMNELKRYQADINVKTKKISYNGKGAHDDTVIALMLSYYAYKNNFGSYTVSFGRKKEKKIRLRNKYEKG